MKKKKEILNWTLLRNNTDSFFFLQKNAPFLNLAAAKLDKISVLILALILANFNFIHDMILMDFVSLFDNNKCKKSDLSHINFFQ